MDFQFLTPEADNLENKIEAYDDINLTINKLKKLQDLIIQESFNKNLCKK